MKSVSQSVAVPFTQQDPYNWMILQNRVIRGMTIEPMRKPRKRGGLEPASGPWVRVTFYYEEL